MWRGGCIIRSVFLGNIKSAYDKNPDLTNLLLDDFFRDAIHNCQVQGCQIFLGPNTPKRKKYTK
jgi:6-phosphogluconate dehydrogenase